MHPSNIRKVRAYNTVALFSGSEVCIFACFRLDSSVNLLIILVLIVVF